MPDQNFKVVVRFRPLIDRELGSSISCAASPEDNTVSTKEVTNVPGIDRFAPLYHFSYDKVFGEAATQEDIYAYVRPAIRDLLDAYNVSILAYGITSSGKSYTMMGSGPHRQGIIPRAIGDIFAHVREHQGEHVLQRGAARVSVRRRFRVWCSYMEIYNEQLVDLLAPAHARGEPEAAGPGAGLSTGPGAGADKHPRALRIREADRRIFVEGLSEHVVLAPRDVYALLDRGNAVRATEETRLNQYSSRSHAIFLVTVEQAEQTRDPATGEAQDVHRLSKLSMVDLAGSERVATSRVSGRRLRETRAINASLAVLGSVISATVEQQRGRRMHVPFRDSKLTRLLSDCIGGNCRMVLIAAVSPSSLCYGETLCTLKFVDRAKQIRNAAEANETLDDVTLLRMCEHELARLRHDLGAKLALIAGAGADTDTPGPPGTPGEGAADSDAETGSCASDGPRGQSVQALLGVLRARQAERAAELGARVALEAQALELERRVASRAPGPPPDGASDGVPDGPAPYRREFERRLRRLEQERRMVSQEAGGGQMALYQELFAKQKAFLAGLTDRMAECEDDTAALRQQLACIADQQAVHRARAQLLTDVLKALQRDTHARGLVPRYELCIFPDGTRNDAFLQKLVKTVAVEYRGEADGSAGSAADDMDGMDGASLAASVANTRDSVAAAECSLERVSGDIRRAEEELQRLRALPEEELDGMARRQRALLSARLASTPRSADARQQAAALQAKIAMFARESVALQAVIERKMGGLVGHLKAHASSGNAESLGKCVATLEKLIGASISALEMTRGEYDPGRVPAV